MDAAARKTSISAPFHPFETSMSGFYVIFREESDFRGPEAWKRIFSFEGVCETSVIAALGASRTLAATMKNVHHLRDSWFSRFASTVEKNDGAERQSSTRRSFMDVVREGWHEILAPGSLKRPWT